MKKILLSLFLIILTSMFSRDSLVYAVKTGPQYLLYEGQLRTPTGEAFTGEFEYRFSFWKNADFRETELTENFSIDTTAENFLGWQERQITTLSDNGFFSLKVGSISVFPETLFINPNIYLQVEIKYRTDKDEQFELIDSDTGNAGYDRMILSSIPFAQNADKLDFRDTGYEAGNIPYLDDEGKLPRALIDAGFGAGDIPYLDEEGKLPSEIIPGDILFLDGEGKLPTTVIPGFETDGKEFIIDSEGTATETDILTLRFGKVLSKMLSWNGLLQRFIFNDNLQVEGNLIVDGEILINGVVIGQYENTEVLTPSYKGAVFDADGTDNLGSMYEEQDTEVGNVLRWTSKNEALQDYDIAIRYRVPEDFISFAENEQVSLLYKTTGAVENASINFELKREGDEVTDEFFGSGMSLTANEWTEIKFTLTDKEKWTAGDTLLMKIKMFATKNFDSMVSDIRIKTNLR